MTRVVKVEIDQVFLTSKEVAALLRVSESTVKSWANQGKLSRKHIHVPGCKQPLLRYLAEEVLEWVREWEPGEFGRGGVPVNPGKRRKE